jgi:hypothetical protein
MKTVTITPPLKQIAEELKKIIDDPQARKRILLEAVLELKDRAAAYPPEGPWNQAPGARGNNIWYQRQWGTRWLKKDGSFGGKNTSEKFQKSWKTAVQQEDTFTASAFTEVSYAPGLLDPAQLQPWAKTHGWQDVNEIAAGYQPRFVELVLAEIDKQIGKL